MLRLGSQRLVVIREHSGEYVDGVWQSGRNYQFTIRGSIQPLNLRERGMTPFGARVSEQRKLYTDAQLDTVELDEDRRGDWIRYDGHCWRVYAATMYDKPTGQRLAHHKYWLERINADDSDN